MSRFKDAVIEQTEKVCTAFVTWGLGVLLMTLYCLVVYWLYQYYGLYTTIVGAMLFLTITYFLIDLWWNLKRGGFSD